MAGTKAGGLKAGKSNKERHGKDFYRRVGKIGGSALHTKPRGFAALPLEARSAAGKKGGANSKRKPSTYV